GGADSRVPVARAADSPAHGERKRGNAELAQHRQPYFDEIAVAVVEGEQGGAARNAGAVQVAAELGGVDEPEPAGQQAELSVEPSRRDSPGLVRRPREIRDRVVAEHANGMRGRDAARAADALEVLEVPH